MWLNIVNWTSSQFLGLLIMFAVPLVIFSFRFLNSRFKKREEEDNLPHPNDWIGQFEHQLNKFEQHNRKIEEMGYDFEFVRENIDLKNIRKKK